jgi:MFS superfamily sulfate permease-like transporter
MKDGYQVRAFNELLALGMANLGGAFMGAVPTQIGLSRMGIAHGAGVKTQMGANVFVAAVVALAVQCCSAALYQVPRCVLNCIIISGASHLTEFDQAKLLWEFFWKGTTYDYKARLDIVTWMSGFLCTLYFGAFKGILIAVFISLMLILYQVVNPSIDELAYKAQPHALASRIPELPEDDYKAKPRARKWVELSSGAQDISTEPGILVFRMDGPLFYANFERMQEWLEEKLVSNQEEASHDSHYHTIILSASAIPWLDSTAVMGLKEMVKSYQAQNPPINFFVAQTFGNAKTILEDKLVKGAYCNKVEGVGCFQVDGLQVHRRPSLQDRIADASSIDDFVEIANATLPEKAMRVEKARSRRSWRASRWVKENPEVANPVPAAFSGAH